MTPAHPLPPFGGLVLLTATLILMLWIPGCAEPGKAHTAPEPQTQDVGSSIWMENQGATTGERTEASDTEEKVQAWLIKPGTLLRAIGSLMVLVGAVGAGLSLVGIWTRMQVGESALLAGLGVALWPLASLAEALIGIAQALVWPVAIGGTIAGGAALILWLSDVLEIGDRAARMWARLPWTSSSPSPSPSSSSSS